MKNISFILESLLWFSEMILAFSLGGSLLKLPAMTGTSTFLYLPPSKLILLFFKVVFVH